ncbi:MAG TPA: serine/threonine-protein kinase [Candidatus Acidoferrum sp.]|nr:serine/threonine-protein kinase [Candidatus Acidoferrum sp.]
MITLNKSRYEALECIGTGTTSRVERARDNVIGRTVALKTFIHGFDEDLEGQFLREAQLVGQLSHPSIVQLYDVGINNEGTPFLVMEYVAGATLEEHLKSHLLPLQRACTWAADIARAMALAHRAGIIHGDIKTGNIFVTPEEKVKLGDFGIAQLATQVSGSGRIKGTPAYLAPEQILGASQDQRSDQFSFGIVFYELLTGVRPFNGDTLGAVCSEILYAEPVPPSKLNPAVPPELDRVIARCLAKNPLERFDSFQQLVTFLYPYTRARHRPPTLSAGKSSWWMQPSKHREVWMVAAAAVVLTVFLEVPQALRGHFGDVSAPPRSYYRPGVPLEAFSYTKQTLAAEPQPDNSDETLKRARKKEIHPPIIQSGKVALAALNRPGDPRSGPLRQSASVLHIAHVPTSNK